MTDEGQRSYAAHEFLFGEFTATRETTLTGEAPMRRLREVVLTTESVSVDGATVVALPDGSQRVAHMFRYVELKGEGLDTLGPVSLGPVRSDTHMNRSTQTPTVYRLQLPSLELPDETTPQFSLEFEGQAKITSISFKPFGGGLPEQFDVAPYTNLGHDQPIVEYDVAVDPTRSLSIDGHEEFDRTKWFRFYGSPSQNPRWIQEFAAERGFYPGRQMFKFEPALVKGYSKNQELLTEDPDRPGYGDPAFFDRFRNEYYKNVPEAFADVRFAMCFNDYPDFMSVPHTGRGTPLAEKFDAAGELVARFLANQIEHSGRTATYWECKNEASIKAEWDYHFGRDENGQQLDSWKLLADFHNTVADAVHERAEGVKIGGPASAWMQVQVGNFGLWKNQARFMDLTKDHVDFYSHHFYEDAASLGAASKESGEYTNYLTGRLEAILDMFAAHGHATDNVKPFLITEFGALNVGRSEADYWLRLRAYSAYLTRFMQRPQQFDMVVPFIFLESSWDPFNAHASFVPDTKTEFRRDEPASWKKTPCAHFFELWRDFQGTRLAVNSPDRLVEVVALRDGQRVHVAISNMSGRRLQVGLSQLGDVQESLQRRLNYLDGRVQYNKVDLGVSTTLELEGEETTTATFVLAAEPTTKSTTTVDYFFGDGTAIKTNESEACTVQIPGPSTVPRRAKLVIGVERSGGLREPLEATLNGADLRADATWARDVRNLFSPVEIPIAAELVHETNAVAIASQEGLTITSVQIVTETVSEH